MTSLSKSLIWRIHNPEQQMIIAAKLRARKSGLPFTINRYDIHIPAVCPLLGIPLVGSVGKGRSNNSPSLDRKDNSKGYTKENIWVVSDLANTMKNSATIDQLKTFAENILKYF